MTTTETISPLALAQQVAEHMGPEWTARQRDYRTNECAEIVNTDGDEVWMTVHGARDRLAADRGKVSFSASYDYTLRDHYPYGIDHPETKVAATRGPEAMAKAVLRKVVPTLVENNQAARERAAEYAGSVQQAQALSQRLAAAIGDYDIRPSGHYGRREDTDRFRVGPYDAMAEVQGNRVAELTFRGIPADMAERFLREVRAHRKEVSDD
jgi:hypothetical protein